jgi:transposase
VKVTDGASKNFAHPHEGALVEATCNAHAFLKFRALKQTHPTEYALAGRVYEGIFDNDAKAKARGLSPVERMHYHRQHSRPLMEELRAMCKEKLEKKLVEPNSLLWEPVSFLINQWPRLTLFYEVPGVPLDSNLVEQRLIIPVRYLAGSFNYQTPTGAEVGDRMMPLVATARANGVEPVACLAHCLGHHEDMAKRPQAYLPWAYRERLGQPSPALQPVQPASC